MPTRTRWLQFDVYHLPLIILGFIVCIAACTSTVLTPTVESVAGAEIALSSTSPIDIDDAISTRRAIQTRFPAILDDDAEFITVPVPTRPAWTYSPCTTATGRRGPTPNHSSPNQRLSWHQDRQRLAVARNHEIFIIQTMTGVRLESPLNNVLDEYGIGFTEIELNRRLTAGLLVPGDESGLTYIETDRQPQELLSWEPGRDRIAFLHWDYERNWVYYLPVDGGLPTSLIGYDIEANQDIHILNQVYFHSAVRGSTILVGQQRELSNPENQIRIFVLDLHSGDEHLFEFGDCIDDYSPTLSHDLTRLAITIAQDVYPPDLELDTTFEISDHDDLYILDIQERVLQNLTNDMFVEKVPTWSPDDTKLAFYRERQGSIETELCIVRVESSERLCFLIGRWLDNRRTYVVTRWSADRYINNRR